MSREIKQVVTLGRWERGGVVVVLAATAAVLATVVSVVGVFNQREGKSKLSAYKESYKYDFNIFPSSSSEARAELAAYPLETELSALEAATDDANSTILCAKRTFLLLGLSVAGVDLVAGNYKLKIDMQPCGDLLRYNGTVLRTFRRSVRLSLDTRVLNFTAGSVVGSQEATISFDEGDINAYPFDIFKIRDLYIEGTYNQNATDVSLLPLWVTFTSGLQTFNIVPLNVTDESESANLIKLDFDVKRSSTTIFFSILVMIIMWILSLLAFTLASSLCIRGRKVEPPTIAFSIALLFALPGIRNTQPGSPPIGCVADVVSFFWAMILVAISAAMLMINYIIKYNFEGIDLLPVAKPPAPPAAAPAVSKAEEAGQPAAVSQPSAVTLAG
ncbi:hypothetical protein HDU96_008721 [Phlyctochytrium bullatum]|nr:hypothetical protein HDU96_008721 [Phlyctochytrium bullatum]